MNSAPPDSAPDTTISAETVVTIWFGPFSLFFAVYWSYIFVQVYEVAPKQSSSLGLSYSILILSMILFFFVFSLYQRLLLVLGRDTANFRRHLAKCITTWLLMSGFTFPMVLALVLVADPSGQSLSALSTAVMLVLLLSVWMLFGLGAMIWEKTPLFKRVKWTELDFPDS